MGQGHPRPVCRERAMQISLQPPRKGYGLYWVASVLFLAAVASVLRPEVPIHACVPFGCGAVAFAAYALYRRNAELRRPMHQAESVYLENLSHACGDWREYYLTFVRASDQVPVKNQRGRTKKLQSVVNAQRRSRNRTVHLLLLGPDERTILFALRLLCLAWTKKAGGLRGLLLKHRMLPVLHVDSPGRSTADEDIRRQISAAFTRFVPGDGEHLPMKAFEDYARQGELFLMSNLSGMKAADARKSLSALPQAFPSCWKLCSMQRGQFRPDRITSFSRANNEVWEIAPLAPKQIKRFATKCLGKKRGIELFRVLADHDMEFSRLGMLEGVLSGAKTTTRSMEEHVACYIEDMAWEVARRLEKVDFTDERDRLQETLMNAATQMKSERSHTIRRTVLASTELSGETIQQAFSLGLLEGEDRIRFGREEWEDVFAAMAVLERDSICSEARQPHAWWKPILLAVRRDKQAAGGLIEDLLDCGDFTSLLLAIACDITCGGGSRSRIVGGLAAALCAKTLNLQQYAEAFLCMGEAIHGISGSQDMVTQYIPRENPETPHAHRNYTALIVQLAQSGFQDGMLRLLSQDEVPLNTRLLATRALAQTGIRVGSHVVQLACRSRDAETRKDRADLKRRVLRAIETASTFAVNEGNAWSVFRPLLYELLLDQTIDDDVRLDVVNRFLQFESGGDMAIPGQDRARLKARLETAFRSEKSKRLQKALSRLIDRLCRRDINDAERRGGDS